MFTILSMFSEHVLKAQSVKKYQQIQNFHSNNFIQSFYLKKYLTFPINNRNKSDDKKVTEYRNVHNPT